MDNDETTKTPGDPESPDAPETPKVDLVEQLFAFTADIDGVEKILTGMTPHGITTFVTGEQGDLFEKMVLASQDVANETGKTVNVVIFERRAVIEKIERKLVVVPDPPKVSPN